MPGEKEELCSGSVFLARACALRPIEESQTGLEAPCVLGAQSRKPFYARLRCVLTASPVVT